jgi:hypothetical protein
LPPRTAVYHYYLRTWRDGGTNRSIHDLLRGRYANISRNELRRAFGIGDKPRRLGGPTKLRRLVG